MTRPQSLIQYRDSFQQCAMFPIYLISLIINFIIVYIIHLISISASILYHRHQVVMLSQGMGGVCVPRLSVLRIYPFLSLNTLKGVV